MNLIIFISKNNATFGVFLQFLHLNFKRKLCENLKEKVPCQSCHSQSRIKISVPKREGGKPRFLEYATQVGFAPTSM